MSTPSQEKSKFVQVPEPEFVEVEANLFGHNEPSDDITTDEDLFGDDESSDEITISDLDVFVEIPWE